MKSAIEILMKVFRKEAKKRTCDFLRFHFSRTFKCLKCTQMAHLRTFFGHFCRDSPKKRKSKVVKSAIETLMKVLRKEAKKRTCDFLRFHFSRGFERSPNPRYPIRKILRVWTTPPRAQKMSIPHSTARFKTLELGPAAFSRFQC